MSTYSVSTLKQDVRIILDNNNVSTQLFNTSDVDTLSLDELIESKLVDAVRQVELAAPVELLDGGTVFPSSSQVVTWKGQAGYGPGHVILPSDFLRLICFKMSDWARPVYNPISVNDPLYAMQSSRFSGVRGNPQKPVVALVVNISSGVAGNYLEFYSCSSSPSATVQMASYIPMPAISNGSINICAKVKSAAVYKAAALVAQSMQMLDLAASLNETVNSLIQI